ncbi:MAG: FAD/NAD(P)-binding protein [Bacteroidales bacterium]
MRRIVVIGAGLSGTLLMINLFRQKSSIPISITWIDRNHPKEMGPAYSTNEDYRLNVPVQLMGALPEDPEHFLHWCNDNDITARPGDYLLRKLYRVYIQEVLSKAQREKSWNLHMQRIRDEAVDILQNGNRLKVSLETSGDIIAEKVILALGNALPANPSLDDNHYLLHPGYVQDPWDPHLLDRFRETDDLLFIGSGQTMTDLVTGLHKRNHQGRLTAISRRGILPMEQKTVDPYPSFYNEIKDLTDVLPVFKIIRQHLRNAEKTGADPRAVIDSLRPHTVDIWMNFPPEEKKRFLRHLFRYWEIIRSRIPPDSDEIIRKLLHSGQLRILKGRLKRIDTVNEPLEIEYLDRDTGTVKNEKAHYIINCKGPDLDYEHIETRLIRNLVSKKIIHCDPAHLGIDALPDGAVLDSLNRPSDRLYALGPMLKGILWESIATPEIRVQAANLARELLHA